MSLEYMGFVRPNGQVGIRNYVAVIPSVVCVNEVCEAIVNQTNNTRGYFHHQGCCQLPPDLERVTDCLVGLGTNPNVGAALVVSLGCEGTDVNRLVEGIAREGIPVERINMQELGGTSAAIAAGIDLAQKLDLEISRIQRERVDISTAVMGIKCGGSDTTSGLASNAAIGYVADLLVDAGASVIFGETTEFIGAEHLLAERAVNASVAADIYRIVNRMESRAKAMGCDMRRGQPTPGNIAGGLSTIEEKSLGAIAKSGSRPIQGVMEYTERLEGRKGLWIKDSPGREIEILTGMAVAGAQFMCFSTGRGAPQGFPTMPVLKICGNPNTYQRMKHDMDINAGLILEGKKTIQEVGEEIFSNLVQVLNGQTTKGESIRYNKSMDIYTLGPVI